MKKLIFIFTSLLLLSLSGCTQEIEVGFEGNGVSVNSIIIEQGESVSNFQRPTRPNYQFDGWFLDASLNRPAPDRLTPEEDITLYAKWTRLYNVNFNTDGGSSVSNIVIRENTNFNLSEINNPTRANHVFDGWFLNESLNQSAPSNFTINADVTIFAKWLRILNVTFNTNGGPNIETISLNENSNLSLSEIPTPSRANHRFDGWFLDEELSVLAPLVITVEDNLTLHSKWIRFNSIVFNTNQGSSIETVTLEENTSFNLDQIENPFRLDYRFEGWYLDPELNQNSPSILLPESDMILYAKWTPTFNTVIFNTNQGSTLAPLRINEESSLNLSQITIPIKANHRFEGWFLDFELTESAPETIELEEDIILYAKWVRGFTVSFNTDGGSAVVPMTIDENDVLELSQLPTPIKTDSLFAGWYTDSSFSTKLTESFVISEDIILYARWTEYSAYEELKSYLINNGTRGELDGVIWYSTVIDDNLFRIYYYEVEDMFKIERRFVSSLESDLVAGQLLWLYLDFFIVNNEIIIKNIPVNYAQTVVGGRLSRTGSGEFYNISLDGRRIVSMSRKADHQLTDLMWQRIQQEVNGFFNASIELALSKLSLDTINVRQRVSLISDLPFEFTYSGREAEIISFDVSYIYYSSGDIRVTINYQVKKTADPAGPNSTESLWWRIIAWDKDAIQIANPFQSNSSLRVGETANMSWSFTFPPDIPIFIEFRPW